MSAPVDVLAVIVNDPNAGNGANTTYRRFSERPYRIRIGGDYLRDAAGRVRSFGSRDAARAALARIGGAP